MAMLYLTKKCDGIFNFPVLDNLFIMSLLDGALRHYELLFLLFKLMMNFRRKYSPFDTYHEVDDILGNVSLEILEK